MMKTTGTAVLALTSAGLIWAQDLSQVRTMSNSQYKVTQSQFKAQRPRTAAAATPARKSVADSGANLVGVTIWRMREARNGDNPLVRILSHEPGSRPETPTYMVPERVVSQAPLREGDHVKISVESSRTGHLYLISRERYADGSTGDPFLIFPSKRIRGGDNAVRGGRVIDVPDWRDDPPYLTVRRQRTGISSEEIVVLVSPQPIPSLMVDSAPVKLSPEQLKEWQAKWGGEVQAIETANDRAEAMTPVEKRAGEKGELLKREDPMPQTLYRVNGPSEQPLLLSFEIKISS